VAVIAYTDGSDKRLVAYLVKNEKSSPTTSDLRQYLHEKLPDYMVPSTFMFVNTLPLTSNGKVDRSALPAPDQKRPDLGKTYMAPRDVVETGLKQIWEECLKIDSIGVQDNFFELGGSSVQAVQVFSRIRKAFSKRLPITTLFQAPTIAQLGIFLQEHNKALAPWSSLVPIQPAGSKPPLFCMHAGAGTVLFYHSMAHCLGPDQPVYGLQAKGLNGNEPPHTYIEDMAAHYINEIRIIQPQGPYYLGGYCLGGILAFEMAQQLIRNKEEVALLANFNSVSPTYVDPLDLDNMAEDELSAGSTKAISAMVSGQWKKFARQGTELKLNPLQLIKKKLDDKMRAIIRRHAYHYYLSRGLPLPRVLRKDYFLETNSQFVKAYSPQHYPGKMVIFRSPQIYPDPHLGWSHLVGGEIETYTIQGDHLNRRDIMNEPFVQFMAQELKKHLKG
jgi:thioesterase domain-containing protein/acyl carrier protein